MSHSSTPVTSGIARLASWCYHRRRRVVVAWAMALALATALAFVAGGQHRADYSMPGSDSAAVRQLMTDRFPDRAGDAVYLVAKASTGLATEDATRRLEELRAGLAGMAHVADVGAPLPAPDGRTTLVAVTLDDRAEAVPPDAVGALIDRSVAAGGDGLQIELGGWPVQYAEQGDAGKEGLGLIAALLVLLVAFGSVLAAGVPIALALVGLGVGSGLAMLIAHLIDIPEWGSMLATMIGIGVGIDYALFIVTRYRNELASGASPHEAVVTAMSTAGRAVVFAGGTVVISLLGLGIIGLEYMWGAALAMVIAVAAVMGTALTLLPAVLGFVGHGIDRFHMPGARRHSGRSERWARWSRSVQRRPVVLGLLAVVILVGLAAPVTTLRFGFPDAGTNPTSLTSRRAFDLTAAAFGAGANGPLLVTVDAPAGDAPVAAQVATDRLVDDPAVAAVLPGATDDGGTTTLLTVVPVGGPQDASTEALVRRLRAEVLPAVSAETGTGVLVGGLTALFIDEADHEGSRLPWFIAAVLLLSFVLLLAVFRAPLVALKAAVLNLLGIAAAYGVVALAVQGGRFGELLGIPEATPVPVFVPILMFAMLFGLSMDYEVFLLSRIREEHQRGRSNSDAVVEGLATTARVISAAAAIMVVVFGAFLLNDDVIAKLAGLGLATAVLLDATLVRMILVPATMELLGERNWWLPGWLDRRLPQLALETRAPVEADPLVAAA
ncbi:MMPL family transporter [Rhabdothermincola salaria]|uniref:MMPL family transporter n=1 Tax=Rhabdothermincola salaria TaxID=2903142 RepID=UPI001E28B31D|nr:MMPL family transporter [Rhabdothermincola salaria]MCD9625427.1 MMPL family transporter [Rhabdothermincola salaria]